MDGLAAAFEDLEQGEGGNGFAVYARRKLGAGKPPTLQLLGDELGVSRERVRQLEKKADDRVAQLARPPTDWPIATAAAQARQALGVLARAEQLAALRARIDPAGEALTDDVPHRLALVLRLAGPYRADGEWLVTDAARSLTTDVLAELTADGPAAIEAVARALERGGIGLELSERWIEHQRRHKIVDGRVVAWAGSMADKAATVLAVAGEPLSSEDLFERIGEPHKSFRSFKNQLAEERFRRRGRDSYGLDVWGGEEYTTIQDEMVQEIERQGGAADLDELAAKLSSAFGVSESSVRLYAGGPQFEVDASRQVRHRVGELPIPPTAPLGLSRRCFRLADGWAFRRTVDGEVERGSGCALPLAFVKQIGIKPRESRKLATPFGGITCSWPSHLGHMGSVRAAAEQLGAVAGDHLLVVAVAPGTLDVRLVEAATCARATGGERLALECGQTPGDDPLREIAAALDLDPAQARLATAIRLRLGERGEHDLAALVADVADPDGDDDDILDALASLGG